MFNFLLIFIQHILILCPIFLTLVAFIPVIKLIYGKGQYKNIDENSTNRVMPLLAKINKSSYSLKKLDSNLGQEPSIIVTRNGILIDEHKIKNLSDNALNGGLLYEITFFEKKTYIIQLILAILVSFLMANIMFYLGFLYTWTGIILCIVAIIFFMWFMEYVNFEQKKNILSSVLKQSAVNGISLESLKEYFTYHKSYFDYFANLKYDIDKQLNFLNSLEVKSSSHSNE